MDYVFFFWDPLWAQPHHVDVMAFLRVAVSNNVVIAANPKSAEYVINSRLFPQKAKKEYE